MRLNGTNNPTERSVQVNLQREFLGTEVMVFALLDGSAYIMMMSLIRLLDDEIHSLNVLKF